MTISRLAGKPGPKEMLVDLAPLKREYFELRPDLDDRSPRDVRMWHKPKSERVLGTKADQKKRWRFLGGTAPFGWQVGEDGALVEIPEQQATIRKILQLRQEGLSLHAIAAKIGGTVSHVTVRSILSNSGAGTGRA